MVRNLTLAIVGNNHHDLGTIHIDSGLNRRGQFTVRGREEMVSRTDDGELGA